MTPHQARDSRPHRHDSNRDPLIGYNVCMRFVWLALTALVMTTAGCERKQKLADSAFTFAAGGEQAAQIPWREWGPEAFAEARESGKPIFLNARGDLCLWCDVLDRTSLSDKRVIRFLSESFIPIRVDVDANPAWAHHYLRTELPLVGVLNDSADLLETRPYLQPLDLIRNVRTMVEQPSSSPIKAQTPRYQPARGRFAQGFLRQFLAYSNLDYDFGNFGYQTGAKSLSGDLMATDLLMGSHFGSKDARHRFSLTLESAYERLYDKHAGGFRKGSRIENWTDPTPVKRSSDQAIMAALLHALPQLPHPEQPLKRSALEYQAAGTKSAEYLLGELVDADGWVTVGEMANRPYYDLPLRERRRKDAPQAARVQTDEMARTAMWLSRAGRWGERPGWISMAETILSQAVAHKTPEGLFWHLPQEQASPNYLGDATAVLSAALELYLATGNATWLTEAEQVVQNLALLKTSSGYAAATTDVTQELYTAELVPALHFELARGLFLLGTVTSSDAWIQEARRLVENWNKSSALEHALRDYALSQWLVEQGPVRSELPAAWRESGEARSLLARPELRTAILWTEEEQARVCVFDHCAEGIISAAEVRALVQLAHAGNLPRVAAAEVTESSEAQH